MPVDQVAIRLLSVCLFAAFCSLLLRFLGRFGLSKPEGVQQAVAGQPYIVVLHVRCWFCCDGLMTLRVVRHGVATVCRYGAE